MTLEEIKKRIEGSLSPSFVDVVDLGGGDHIRAVVVSEVFSGKPLIQQHKMVLDLFKSEIESNEVHALTVKTMTPAQFTQR